MNYEHWRRRYHPQQNHLVGNMPYDGTMFEAYDKELAYVREIAKKEPGRVWTLGDNGYIMEGFHYVNRLGYFVTEHPVSKKDEGRDVKLF